MLRIIPVRFEVKLLRLNKRQLVLIKFGLGLLFFGAIAEQITMYLLHANGYFIAFNRTTSLPQYFWLVNTNSTTNFVKNEYFSFYAPEDKMLTEGESTPLVKIVAGIPGDKVTINKSTLLINNKVMGHIWPKTMNGHKLAPITSQTISRGCYFAWTPALYSYDSRYKDVGIVCESQNRIIGSAKPLF